MEGGHMEAKIVWLFLFVFLYWAYCIFWGVKCAIAAKTATDYFIAGRGISIWVFVLAATATSFSGWTFMGHHRTPDSPVDAICPVQEDEDEKPNDFGFHGSRLPLIKHQTTRHKFGEATLLRGIP